jgi:hypothetical protein
LTCFAPRRFVAQARDLISQLSDERGHKQATHIFAHVLRSVVEPGECVTAERVRRALETGEPLLLALRLSEPALDG